ncbi:hypothetical protein F0919_07785 [Taibaiella lutea]|uniref:DUF3578 domain-containing protein n=1 Tax=Taibaiella lutea TaxID=2608001 RepID=A0A5M6CHP0_9BACT|nr:hypothetical protein [Taibaiella lutea]KAA5534513.1 hypothetical protein F0919_07785 [Taibaiella lutea]
MLRDYRELAGELKNKFRSIDIWPELIFNDEDKQRLMEVDQVSSVDSHSLQMKIDNNHCILPSQYVLYAVCIKELALALKDHMDVFDLFKINKSQEDIGRFLLNENFVLSDITSDKYSESIALKPFNTKDYSLDAKSIVNGSEGSYKIRGTSDFFTSILLKVINIPDASSAIVGKFIFKLTQNKSLYNYLERRFLGQLPYITKHKEIGKFIRAVIYFLLQYDENNLIFKYIRPNQAPGNLSLELDDIKLTSIFRTSPVLLNQSDLSQGGIARSFTEPILYNNQNQFLYLSNQWTNGTGSRLDLQSFKKLLEFDYPEFYIAEVGQEYFLKSVNGRFRSETFSDIDSKTIAASITKSNLQLSNDLILRFTGALLTKPFVILTGLSGSGKTKLAQAFSSWICEDDSQYCIVPVGADWTNREPLLGFPNALIPDEYIMPQNGALKLIIESKKEENKNKPYFLILDEMNLSHVERYFADFLSAMESKSDIELHSIKEEKNKIPSKINLPSNLFIIGTVNIDETTYMFSPKVLDRASVIEFRVSEGEMKAYLDTATEVNMESIKNQGAGMGQDFITLASEKSLTLQAEDITTLNKSLLEFFLELKKTGSEFGYRSASEILRFAAVVKKLNSEWTIDMITDAAIMQKLLPKVHGSRKKLAPVLEQLGSLCLKEGQAIKDVFDKKETPNHAEIAKYPTSLEKITRMYHNLLDNGFTSYAEA